MAVEKSEQEKIVEKKETSNFSDAGKKDRTKQSKSQLSETSEKLEISEDRAEEKLEEILSSQKPQKKRKSNVCAVSCANIAFLFI